MRTDPSAARLVAADLLWRAPARAPHALPNPVYTLFIPDYLRPVALESVAEVVTTPVVSEVAAPSAAMPVVSAGAVRTRAEKVYYEVDGDSREDLAAALQQHGPRIQGKRFFGMTEWTVSAEYRPMEGGTGCAVRDLTVRVSVQTRLPRWTPLAGASVDLSGVWERFVAALDEHEDGHRALAEEAADAIRRKLAAVQAPSCDQLDLAAQREMTVVMREYESHNLAYDAETGHGRTQGAVWPPRDG